MFRRRTDQVYATLQQVQRRITEQAPGSPAPTADRSGTVPPFGPLQEALQRQKAPPPPVVGHQPEPPPPPPQLVAAPRGGIGFTISLQLGITLLVLWLISCVLCFQAGQAAAERRSQHATEGFALGDAGNRQPQAQPTQSEASPPAKPLGPDLLVLTQVQTATPETEQSYRQRADQLNKIMLEKGASRGWKPWFGVRRPSNGSLQLVFGQVAEGVYGVKRKDFDDFARMLAQPPPNGGGYATAIWVNAN